MHNATEGNLPNIDDSLPRLQGQENFKLAATSGDEIQAKYGICTNPSSVAADPLNQMVSR